MNAGRTIGLQRMIRELRDRGIANDVVLKAMGLGQRNDLTEDEHDRRCQESAQPGYRRRISTYVPK